MGSAWSGLQSDLSEMGDIFVCIVGHFFQRAYQLVVEDVWVDVLAVLVDDFADTESHIWDIILRSGYELWHDVLGYLIFHEIGHDGRERIQAANPVVIAFLVYF